MIKPIKCVHNCGRIFGWLVDGKLTLYTGMMVHREDGEYECYPGCGDTTKDVTFEMKQ